MLLLGSIVLLRSLSGASRLYRGQATVVLGSISLPWAASALYVAGLVPIPGLDPTPLAFVLTDLILGWSVVRGGVLTGSVGVIPLARECIVEAIYDGMLGLVVLDRSHRIVDVNPAAARLLDRDARSLIGEPFALLPPSPAPWDEWLRSSDRRYELSVGEGLNVKRCSAHLTAVADPVSPSSSGWLLMLQDVTEQKRIEAALTESERRYRTVVNNLTEVVFQTDVSGRWTLLNPAWTALTGYTVPESLGTWATTYVHPDDRSRDEREWRSLMDGEKNLARYELRFSKIDGAMRWFEVHARPITTESGAIVGIAGTLVDTTDRKLLQEQLRHQAFHDTLTGLANRALFRERVEHALHRLDRAPAMQAIVFLDLDHFKKVNDSLGHSAGDELLCTVARRLVQGVRMSDTVARLGGDEFAILLEDLVDSDEALVTAERILDALRVPMRVDGRDILVGASLGIAPLRRGAESVDAILRNADIAMYAAKRQGRGCSVIFTDDMDAASRQRLELEGDLARAIDRDEMTLAYQPLIELGSEQIVGVEALIRWRHPERGLIHPAEFIGIAEETGLIVPIGRWVLRRACREARRWQASDPTRARFAVAVNLSARQLQDPHLVDDVAAILAESGIDPMTVTLEITETVAMQNIEATIVRLEALKALKVRIAIDDFGTGYSSLSYLQRFPIDILKIDRTFVRGIAENEDDRALTRTILQLARTLRLDTIAEGIETFDQLERLRAFGCAHGQGYYFARPLPPEQIDELVADALVAHGHGRSLVRGEPYGYRRPVEAHVA